DVVKRHVGDAVHLVETAGAMKSGVRGNVDRVVAGEQIEKRQPAKRLAERAVQVDQGRPLPAAHDHGRPTGDIDDLWLAALARQGDPGSVTEFADRVK